jgi:hypothetical protein
MLADRTHGAATQREVEKMAANTELVANGSSTARIGARRSRLVSWLVPDDPCPADPWDVGQLKRVRDDYRKQHMRARRQVGALLATSIGLVLLSALAWRLFDDTGPGLALGAVAVTVFVGFLLVHSQEQHLHDEQLEADDEYERAKLADEITGANSPQRAALKLFQNHSARLRRYYDQALRQARVIFWVGLLCLAAGFSAIGVALALVVLREDSLPDLSDKVIVAALGAVGGVLANFIGVVYIRIHSATIRSLSEFHNRLVATNYLHFGNFLVTKIADSHTQDLALAGIAEAIAGQAQGIAGAQEAVLKLDWARQPIAQGGSPP